MSRFLLALHATAPVALVVAILMHLFPPAGLTPLAQRPVWTVWALIGAWLLLSALCARTLRRHALWRTSLGGTGALLTLAGVVGWARGSAQAPAMLGSLTVLGMVCAGLAAFIGPARVQAPRRSNARQAAAQAMRPAADAAPHARRARRAGSLGRPAHLPFWLCGMLAVESFRLAHIVATEPARSSGMLGLLLAFFVGLPAATLHRWAPRTAALLWAVAALAYGGLATKAGMVPWTVASALCTAAACLQRFRSEDAA